jgi:hypothetical protein
MAQTKPDTAKKEERDYFAGFTRVVRETYDVIDASGTDEKSKRDMLYSLYSFRCIFDNREFYNPSKVLEKYGIIFFTDAKNKDEEGVFAIDGESARYKYDVGSAYFLKCARLNPRDPRYAIPQKLTLYELCYAIVTLDNIPLTLKAKWFAYIPYIFVLRAPVEHDLYDALQGEMLTDEVFDALLHTDEGDEIYVDESDLDDDPLLRGWYLPYIRWRNEKPNGIARYDERISELIRQGNFAKATAMADAYVPAYPDDEELLLLDVTARATYSASLEGQERKTWLEENLRIIEDAVSSSIERHADFLYFSGLTKLALMDVPGAEKDLSECLAADPNYSKATKLLIGIHNAEKLSEDKE